eukprot:CAMPEP_0113417832 /NCGR_PEP_ID=MMETSP0013_2-20120614/25868_1 /TAXON_ID=2843 ORGANISM="Skeletonema costatum, Strain 1716" /NCGR_SAMPLE_ID=MMETSP0013_2 /ASSEMBLY_ACC=CAM_ASM_000158 /LENGTH=158 /DNA_ID=CAMNT_0000304997 /DNA_START=331 /DNA_END=807 /DNA_ORIENTATION=- /assembly_acc=CAM_ASM_000158
MLTIEAELCKTLNISWADARDLSSYARGKLGIIPGDKVAEQTHRQSILTAAIVADKQFPKKRNLTKGGEPEIRKEGLINKDLSNPKHNTTARQELVVGVQDATAPAGNTMMDRGNAKVANVSATAHGTNKTQKEMSSCAACLQCFNTVGQCCALFSFC